MARGVYYFIFNVLPFILIFSSPIIISFVLIIYNIVKFIKTSKNEIESRKKYKKGAIISLMVFILIILIYFGFLYYISYMIMSTM